MSMDHYKSSDQPSTPAGWYPEPGNEGVLRYWSGKGWEEWRKPRVMNPVRPTKDVAAAILFGIFLGGFGAHNFYLDRTGVAIAQLLLTIVGWLTAWFFVGFFLIIGVGIWVLIELFMIPEWVRAENSRSL